MISTLARFQDDFSRALLAAPGAATAAHESEVAALAAQPAFAVYRNTVLKGCIDALEANFPAVLRLVGDEWFRAAAALFVREALPGEPTLLRYGAGFPAFLSRFEPAAELPYLAGVARLDWLWTEAHAARDERPLDAAAVAALAPDAMAHTLLVPHAAARWAWFDDLPVFTIWSRNRSHETGAEIEWRGEGALLTRDNDNGSVQWRQLDVAGCAMLDACARGEPLSAAAGAALAAQSGADLAHLMSVLLHAGAFTALKTINASQATEEQP